MRGVEGKITSDIDWSLVGLYFLLVIFGISNVYSSVYNPLKPNLFDLSTEHGKQIMWVGIAMFFGIIILIVDGNLIRGLYLGVQAVGHCVSQNRTAYWDGKDDCGRVVSTGIYFYTLRTHWVRDTRPMCACQEWDRSVFAYGLNTSHLNCDLHFL